MNGSRLLLCGAASLLPLLGLAAEIRIARLEMKTYPFSDPNPVPMTAERIYPYFRYDGSSVGGVTQDWQVVTLENDRLRVSILPEVGGKVWAAFDKVAGRDFLYCNHVMKFRDVAMRGPWLSGGIEYNFGILGHAPSSSTPVDWLTRTNADGSVSCFVSSAEYITRTSWQVEVRLGRAADSFETRVSWHNASNLPQPYYHWMNAAYSLRGDPEFLFPGSVVIGHEGEIESTVWPEDAKGRRISVYRENAFGGPKSYHVLPGNNGFYGIWWRDGNYGSFHRSSPYEKYGRKIWLWALSREGGIWEDLLTDSDGQYAELQSGRCYNQPRWGNYRTPFKHPTFAPGSTECFAESWGPIRSRRDVEKDVSGPQPEQAPFEPPADFDWNSAYGLYRRGEQALRERYDGLGETSLRQALELDRNFVPALDALAEVEFRRGDTAEARALCRRALSVDGYDAEANYLDGFAAFVEGDAVTSRARLGLAAFAPQYRSPALTLIARGYLREGNAADAAVAAEKALKANADNPETLLVRIVAARGTAAAAPLIEAALMRYPLFHAFRYEAQLAGLEGDFGRHVRNELPQETFLEMAAWYAETGLLPDAKALLRRAGDCLLAKIRLGDLASARKSPVAGVFPFRREDLPDLKRAATEDGHWKFKYLYGVILAFFNRGQASDRWLDSCGGEPDDAVFYQYRASRRTGARRLADLHRAQALGDSWRVGRSLAAHFEEAGDFPSMLAVTGDYLSRHPACNPLQIAHARALVGCGRHQDCLDFLKDVRILPSEHRDAATDVWQRAQKALGLKPTWPENLGRGEPYPNEEE